MLIGHKNEIEHHLTEMFLKINAEDIGNDYLFFESVGALAVPDFQRSAFPIKTSRLNPILRFCKAVRVVYRFLI
jgi:hypothetical protein